MKDQKPFLFVLLSFVAVVFFSCASTPQLRFFGMGPDYDNGRITYFPPTKWSGGKEVYCLVDINHRSVPEMPVLCGVSIVGKKNVPRGISAVYFQNSQGGIFALTDIKGVSAEPKKNLVRISGTISQEAFAELIKSEELTLMVTMEGINYSCVPSKAFTELRRQFVDMFYLDAYINRQAAP